MPQTRLERILAFTGLLAIAGLVALVVPAWFDYRDAELTQPAAPSAASPATEMRERHSRSTPVPAAHPTRLTVVAARGDCWLLVRRGSESGEELYQGVLAEGELLTFTSKRLWIRLGAGENLDVMLNGKPVKELSLGVGDVVATGAGIRPA